MSTVIMHNNFKKLTSIINKQNKPKILSRKISDSVEYCASSVKKNDYENYICTLLLKNTARSCAFAVRSFNVEVARVAEQVSQANTGQMRLKFWEETIDKCLKGNTVPNHPVAIEIYKANIRKKLSKRYFINLISSRLNSLKLTSFNTLDEMEKYAEQSTSNVLYLVLEGSGVQNIEADHAASHLGKAQGIIQQLRSIPHAKHLNFISIPQEILVKNKVSQEEVIRGKTSERLSECTFEIASRAHQHLVKARSLSEKVPKEGKSALLPAVPVSIYLDRLQQVDYDVFHPSLKHRSWKFLPQVWISDFRNKY
ncbi:unnamed protein product [Phaedon cochleariae]|uniref:NADH dehydrogenase (Ubiquinone) complex I, assembly factor 6 n=1 Tax=Phaedon cochleariae TaxID=80249 RepID=A0A9P0GTB1_PHACE|nr:unnamed protein product [Phaedon cochleariae]